MNSMFEQSVALVALDAAGAQANKFDEAIEFMVSANTGGLVHLVQGSYCH